MPEQTNTLGELLELAIRLEQAAEALYRGLEARFAHHPEVAAFWAQYAKEEAGHARWLEILRDRMGPDHLFRPADLRMIEVARDLLRTPPEQLLERVENLEDAYRLVTDLENSETNAIFEFLISDPAMAEESRVFLRSQLHEHINRLVTDFPQAYAGTANRLSVKAQR